MNIPVIFGEVLFDRFPDGNSVLGGAPFNVAWHLQAFGARPLLISSVGDDELGAEIRQTMQDWGMDDSGLQTDAAHPTGTVEVSFNAGEPEYDIVDGRAYDKIRSERFPEIKDAALIYHGSLALRDPVSRQSFEKLAADLKAPLFLDVNLRPPWWNPGEVQALMRSSAWIKLNQHELAELRPHETADAVRDELQLRALILTKGAEGAQILAPGTDLEIRPKANEQLVDTVGAGDAFTSVMLLGLLLDWPWSTTLERAQAFAGAITGIRGATVQDAAFYQAFRADWGIE